MSTKAELDVAYSLWAERLVNEGWTPYLLTFMFGDIEGPVHEVARIMEREVERIYATVLSRIIRNPNRVGMIGKHPVWICCHDRPVYKLVKTTLRDVTVNDGRHIHAVALIPPWSRMSEGLADHFDGHRALYLRPDSSLIRIHTVPITRRVGYVTTYVRKHTRRGAHGEDAGFILPRTLDEIRDRGCLKKRKKAGLFLPRPSLSLT